MRALVTAMALLMLSPWPAGAEWQIRPFASLSFGGTTTYVLEAEIGDVNPSIGASVQFLGDVVGLEGDFGYAPGFFGTGGGSLVADSSVTTVTGNLVLAVPRRLAAYSLRPYFAVGTGVMHVSIEGVLGVFPVSSVLPAIDVGGGVTGFVSDRFGVSWDVRYFGSLRRERVVSGITIGGEEQLSFWRASMALVLRY